MNIETERIVVEQLIMQYADAVNTANARAIAAFYTEDGLLMPEGFRSVIGSGVNGGYFKRASVSIEYVARDILIDGNYAFIEARATTKTTSLATSLAQTKTTRDFFVLKRITGSWMIYRYIFNNEQQH